MYVYVCMHVCMYVYVWMGGCMDVWMYGYMDSWMYGRMDGCIAIRSSTGIIIIIIIIITIVITIVLWLSPGRDVARRRGGLPMAVPFPLFICDVRCGCKSRFTSLYVLLVC